ncbi:MAG: hypothetical protein KAS72_09530 [Phycisphaerales bacterium]|nr:hypothetical protein [Phycisphaerales bacterium]
MNWRKSLEQLCERNGSLEIALPRYLTHTTSTDGFDESGSSLIWRVRLLELQEDGILIEQPSALGQTIHMDEGIDLVAIMAIGQNRWMFKTRITDHVRYTLNERRKIIAMRVDWPTKVERCQRRNFYRVSTVAISLPTVLAYPVLDAATIWAAEEDSRARMSMSSEALLRGDKLPDAHPVLPEVGPNIEGTLLNIGGGGIGLQVESECNGVVSNHRHFWLQMTLPPVIITPFGVAARLAHTHIDSTQAIYLGMQFDFSHSPQYKKFIIDQICKYVTETQREQLRRHREDMRGEQ